VHIPSCLPACIFLPIAWAPIPLVYHTVWIDGHKLGGGRGKGAKRACKASREAKLAAQQRHSPPRGPWNQEPGTEERKEKAMMRGKKNLVQVIGYMSVCLVTFPYLLADNPCPIHITHGKTTQRNEKYSVLTCMSSTREKKKGKEK
jgi:hypothetical protein